MGAKNRLMMLAVFAVLSGCGGGSGSSSAGNGQANIVNTSTNVSLAPTFIAFTPSAATVASKKTNSSLVFSSVGSGTPPNQGCGTILSNKTVYEQAHTVVFAADGVSEKDQQEISEYAEAAVLELRTKFPTNVSTTIGIVDNKKVYVCVQPQRVGTSATLALAAPVSSSSYGGIIIAQSASNYFFGADARDALIEGKQSYSQDYYRTSQTHEVTHLVSNFNLNASADQWFEEGFARWMQFGKPAITKEVVLAQIATQNPITISTPGNFEGSVLLKDYNTAAAVITYLILPTGANNGFASISAFWARYKADAASLAIACGATPVGADCASISAYEAKRVSLFSAAFEGTFKEKDGSQMKLRSGTNNLQDTLTARLTAFW